MLTIELRLEPNKTKRIVLFIVLCLMMIAMVFEGCGPSYEEVQQQKAEKRKADSLQAIVDTLPNGDPIKVIHSKTINGLWIGIVVLNNKDTVVIANDPNPVSVTKLSK